VTANVEKAVKEEGVTYPVLIDARAENWRRWGTRYWPTVWLIDKQGKARYRWEGELEYKNAGGEATMARLVEELLREN
jgi:hypothetical protein